VILTKRLLLAMLATGLASIPAFAGPAVINTWTFGGSGGASAGFSFTDGTAITGNFTFNADVSTSNCSPSCDPTSNSPQPADYNGNFGLFGSGVVGATQTGTTGGVTGSFNVSQGSYFGAASAMNWYLNTNSYDGAVGSPCCSAGSNTTSPGLFLVSANPTSSADLTDLNYQPGLSVCTTSPSSDPLNCTDNPGSDAAFGIQLYLTSNLDDGGNLYAPGDVITTAFLGVCNTTECGGIDTSTQLSTFDSAANVNTGSIPINPGGTPEPSTLVLGVSALAFGVFRKKLFRARQ
jgi:hypothetical protein